LRLSDAICPVHILFAGDGRADIGCRPKHIAHDPRARALSRRKKPAVG